jgi:hypothetical protein
LFLSVVSLIVVSVVAAIVVAAIRFVVAIVIVHQIAKTLVFMAVFAFLDGRLVELDKARPPRRRP